MDILSYQERFVDKRNDELILRLIENTENYKSDSNNDTFVKQFIAELRAYLENNPNSEKSTDQ